MTSTGKISAGFNFGSPATASTSSTPNLFGFSTSSSTNTAPFGFTAAPSNTSTTTTFGNATDANKGIALFGSSNNQPPTGSIGNLNFGAKLSGNPPSNTTTFPLTTTNAFQATGFGAPTNLAPNNISAKRQGPVSESIEKVLRAYASVKDNQGNYEFKGEGRINDECQFKTVVLTQKTAVPSRSREFMALPDQTLLLDSLMEEAEKVNFDPSNFVPFEEIGVAALQARYDDQVKEIDKITDHIKKIKDLIHTSYESNRALSHRIALLKMKQTPLNQKLLSILRKIEILRCHGNPLQMAERNYRNKIIQVLDETQVPRHKLEEISVNLVSLLLILLHTVS